MAAAAKSRIAQVQPFSQSGHQIVLTVALQVFFGKVAFVDSSSVDFENSHVSSLSPRTPVLVIGISIHRL